MIYDLWDVESANRVGAYPTEEQALRVVLGLLAANGEDYVEALSLSYHDGSGHGVRVASGAELAQRARAAVRITRVLIQAGVQTTAYFSRGDSATTNVIHQRAAVGLPPVRVGAQSGAAPSSAADPQAEHQTTRVPLALV